MKKREIFLLIILFIGIYAFIFVKFIWGGAIPEIDEIKAQIEEVKKEKAQLDEDLKNIEKLKSSLEVKNVQDQRIDEYLMSDASSADSIDYLDKLTKLFEHSVTDISFANPLKIEVPSSNKGNSSSGEGNATEKKTEANTYYELRFSFKAEMTYDESMELVNFIEGGSRKVKISKFHLKPSSKNSVKTGNKANNANNGNNNSNGNNGENSEESSDGLFSVDMTVNMYSKNLGSINNIYNYAKNNFNRFNNNDGKVIIPNPNVNLNQNTPDGVVSYNDNAGSGKSGGTVSKENKRSDIEIRLGSFMTAGPNFEIFDAGGYGNIFYRIKTKEVTQVEINLLTETFTIDVSSPENGSRRLRGALSNEEPHINVKSNFPTHIDENKNLGIDLMIRNESGKMVSIFLTDKNNSVRITDRNGSVIRGYSKSENVKII